MLGLYVHIPFCAEKCYYCDFNSYKIKRNDEKKEYLLSLSKEMKLYKNEFKDKQFTSIFLGGGTPSILNTEELEILMNSIFDNFNINSNAEITIECNPGTLNQDKLTKMKDLGINRLSIGLQTTKNKYLKNIGRIHTYEQFEKNYKQAIEVGFDNINIDLMYSLPNQTFEDWKETLGKIIDLNPKHISAYSLILEEDTKLYKMYEEDKFNPIDEEVDIKIYEYTINRLRENGYHQYEISNYAKEGYECKHNVLYWKCENYLGLGAGASGYINNTRYCNVENIEEYKDMIEMKKKPIQEKNDLTNKDKIEEYIIMALRMNEGININEFENKFNENFKQKYNHILEKLKNENLIEEQNNHIRFTQRGREISNSILIEFIE